MVGLVTRYHIRGLVDYFYEDLDGRVRLCLPNSCRGLCAPRWCSPGDANWRDLTTTEFMESIPAQSGRVLAYEFGFAPPKSYSIAALLGVEQNPELVSMHANAVGDAVSFIPYSLVPRAGKRGAFGSLLTKPIFRFTHFANRANEPQLHEHVVVIASGEDRSPDGTLLYWLQRKLDCVYLYSLAVQLLRGGYGTIPKGSRWELQGVNAELIKKFSSRSMSVGDDWSPSQKRAQLLSARKQLGPKADWAAVSRCFPIWRKTAGHLFSGLKRSEQDIRPADLSLERLFRENSTQTLLDLLVSAIRSGSAGDDSFGDLLNGVNDLIWKAENEREIVYSFERGTKICHVETFRTEERVLDAFRDGLGHGVPINADALPEDLPVLMKALAAPNRLRLLELPLTAAMKAEQWLCTRSPLAVSRVNGISASAILEVLEKQAPEAEHFIIVTSGSAEPSSFRSELLTMLVQKPSSLRLQRGRVPISVIGFGSRPYHDAWRILTNGPGPGVIVGMGDPDVLEPVRKNFQRLAAKGDVVPIDVEQPWTTAAERSRLLNSWLIGLKRPVVVRHGTRWRVAAVSDSGVDVVSPSGRFKSIPWTSIERVRERVAFVRVQHVVWPYGTSAKIVRGLGRKGQKSSKAGEWHLLGHVFNDGTLELESGVGMFPGFRLLAPQHFISGAAVSGIERLIVWNEEGSAEEILKHRPSRTMMIFTQFPKILSRELRRELLRQRELKGRSHSQPVDKPSPRHHWRHLLSPAKAGPAQPLPSPGKKLLLKPGAKDMPAPGDD